MTSVAERAAQFRGRLGAGAYRLGEVAARVTPRPVASTVTTGIARAAALASPERRLIVERNLHRVYGPRLRGARLGSKIGETFDSYARYFYDSFRLPAMSAEEIERGFELDGAEHLEAALRGDVGPVLALPHLGGWEWAAAWITKVRRLRLAAVVEELDPPELFEWFLEFRQSLGMNIIPLGPKAASQVAAAALDRQIVCLLADRDIGGSGVEVSFFGERTTLPAGPALMALRTGCPLLPTAAYFRRRAGVHGVVRPPLPVERRGRLREDVQRITQDLAGELEVLIRRAPEQWHLMQPNWPSDHAALERLHASRRLLRR